MGNFLVNSLKHHLLRIIVLTKLEVHQSKAALPDPLIAQQCKVNLKKTFLLLVANSNYLNCVRRVHLYSKLLNNLTLQNTLEFLISVAPQINAPPGIWVETISILPSNKRPPPLLKKDDFHAIWYLKSKFSNLQKAFCQN